MTEDLLQAAIDYFKKQKWPLVARPGRPVIQTLFPATGAPQYDGYLHVVADTRQFVYYSVYGQHAPPARIAAMTELVARLNFDLLWGNLEVNVDNGGIRFKTALTLGDAPFDPELLRPLVAGNAVGLFRFEPCIAAVIEGGISVADAAKLAM